MQNHAEGDKPHISDLDETLHEGISLGAMNFGTNHMVGMLVHFTSGVTTQNWSFLQQIFVENTVIWLTYSSKL